VSSFWLNQMASDSNRIWYLILVTILVAYIATYVYREWRSEVAPVSWWRGAKAWLGFQKNEHGALPPVPGALQPEPPALAEARDPHTVAAERTGTGADESQIPGPATTWDDVNGPGAQLPNRRVYGRERGVLDGYDEDNQEDVPVAATASFLPSAWSQDTPATASKGFALRNLDMLLVQQKGRQDRMAQIPAISEKNMNNVQNNATTRRGITGSRDVYVPKQVEFNDPPLAQRDPLNVRDAKWVASARDRFHINDTNAKYRPEVLQATNFAAGDIMTGAQKLTSDFRPALYPRPIDKQDNLRALQRDQPDMPYRQGPVGFDQIELPTEAHTQNRYIQPFDRIQEAGALHHQPTFADPIRRDQDVQFSRTAPHTVPPTEPLGAVQYNDMRYDVKAESIHPPVVGLPGAAGSGLHPTLDDPANRNARPFFSDNLRNVVDTDGGLKMNGALDYETLRNRVDAFTRPSGRKAAVSFMQTPGSFDGIYQNSAIPSGDKLKTAFAESNAQKTYSGLPSVVVDSTNYSVPDAHRVRKMAEIGAREPFNVQNVNTEHQQENAARLGQRTSLTMDREVRKA